MSEIAVVAAIWPNQNGSSTMGVKKSTVCTSARARSIRNTPASSAVAEPTSRFGLLNCGRSCKTSVNACCGSLAAHPAQEESEVSFNIGWRTSIVEFEFRNLVSRGGEDRNRTYPGSQNGPATVLKTARATRHPSLSEKFGRQILDLTCWAIASKSGHSPVSSLEWMSSPLTRISKAPPPDAINLGFTPAAFRMEAANLAAFGS